MIKNIIFDLDGTLIDSKKEVAATYAQVFDKMPPPTPVDPLQLNFGATLQNVLTSVYGNDQPVVNRAKQLFASIYDNSLYEETTLYERVEETLDILKTNGYILHIATNKRFAPTMRILEVKKLGQYITRVAANEMTPGITLTKQEMIASIKNTEHFSDGYMVGDSVTDIEAGALEKLLTIAVTYGYDSKERLLEKKPTYVADNFYNLYTFVSKPS